MWDNYKWFGNDLMRYRFMNEGKSTAGKVNIWLFGPKYSSNPSKPITVIS